MRLRNPTSQSFAVLKIGDKKDEELNKSGERLGAERARERFTQLSTSEFVAICELSRWQMAVVEQPR